MVWQGLLQISLILLILAVVSPFLGKYIAQVFQAKRSWLDRFASPLEQFIYALGGLCYQESMTGWHYARAVFYSNLVMGVLVYSIFLLQAILPFNSTNYRHLPGIWRCILLSRLRPIPISSITLAKRRLAMRVRC